ncbi:MAG: DUF456 domain-containing protein [Caldilineaceae bacterium]
MTIYDWFSTTPLNLWSILAYLLILIGLAGSVIPVLPGPSLIWVGMLIWAWADNFQRLGWGMLALAGVLAIISWALDFVLGPLMSRRAGASWRAILGGIIGGLAGGFFLTFIPVIGTIGGALVGAIVGMWLVEYNIRGDSKSAMSVVKAYVMGMLFNTILEVIISLLMVGLFIFAVATL